MAASLVPSWNYVLIKLIVSNTLFSPPLPPPMPQGRQPDEESFLVWTERRGEERRGEEGRDKSLEC